MSAVAMKESGVEWLGEIPYHWDLRNLKYIARLEYGDSLKAEDRLNGDIPVFGSNGLVGYHDVSNTLAPAIVVGRKGSFGKVNFSNTPVFAIDTTYFVDTRTTAEDLRWVYYILQILELDKTSKDSAIPGLGREEVYSLRAALPPLHEQRAIASYLDRETARIDRLINKTQALNALLREKRVALISRAVTKGLDAGVEMKESGVEWLGEIPSHWDVTYIKQVATNELYSFIDGDWIESPYITQSGIRLIQTGNIGVGEYREQGHRYISEESFNELDCTEVFPNDVLICRLAEPVGRACLAPDLNARMITSVDVCILRPRPRFDANFVVYFLSIPAYLSWLAALARGSTRSRVSRTMLGNIQIVAPPLHEQRAIASYLDRETAKIDRLINKNDELIALLREKRSALISAAVTGKISVPSVSASKS